MRQQVVSPPPTRSGVAGAERLLVRRIHIGFAACTHTVLGATLPRMRRMLPGALLLVFVVAAAAARQHAIAFGPWTKVKLFVGAAEENGIDLKVRSLIVDGRLKEFTTGDPHDVTDRIFVVRRAFRLNDSLPVDPRTPQRWRWQRGGWVMVDRLTGSVKNLNLPEFDPYYSAASWYRDYVAYCGISDSGERLYAVVAQVGRRKAIVRKELGAPAGHDAPDSECGAPAWQRQPMRVTFAPAGGQPVTFTVHGHAADIATEEEKSDQ